jgi:hypothetical protein
VRTVDEMEEELEKYLVILLSKYNKIPVTNKGCNAIELIFINSLKEIYGDTVDDISIRWNWKMGSLFPTMTVEASEETFKLITNVSISKEFLKKIKIIVEVIIRT